MSLSTAQMAEKFRARTSGLAADLTDAMILEYMNRAYQHVIPRDVGGSYSENLWKLECVPLQDEYDFESFVVAPRSNRVWINSYRNGSTGLVVDADQTFLDVETELGVWQMADREVPESSTGQRPDSILFWGRKVYVSPTPDERYIVKIPSRMGPQTALGESGSGLTESMDDETYALAVITYAAWEYLLDKEDHESAVREGGAYEKYKSLMQAAAHGTASHRRWKRSF